MSNFIHKKWSQTNSSLSYKGKNIFGFKFTSSTVLQILLKTKSFIVYNSLFFLFFAWFQRWVLSFTPVRAWREFAIYGFFYLSLIMYSYYYLYLCGRVRETHGEEKWKMKWSLDWHSLAVFNQMNSTTTVRL